MESTLIARAEVEFEIRSSPKMTDSCDTPGPALGIGTIENTIANPNGRKRGKPTEEIKVWLDEIKRKDHKLKKYGMSS